MSEVQASNPRATGADQAGTGRAAAQRARGWQPFALTLTLALLASCGGEQQNQGGANGTSAGSASTGRSQALSTQPPSPIPADAAVKGMWGPVAAWPLIAIHAVVMPDGRVLTYGSRPDGQSSAFASMDVWDNVGNPDVGHTSILNTSGNDLFCGTQLMLPPLSPTAVPNVFMAGGDSYANGQTSFIGITGTTLFKGDTNTVQATAQLSSPRWYSTAITLVNGETYIQGGFGGGDRPDVRQLDGTMRRLTTADTGNLLWSYPRNYVMPDGRVFGYDFEGRMYFVDTSGTGAVSMRTILPLQYFGSGSSALFRPGRILQMAGNTNAAAVIDVTSGNPVFTPTQSLSSVRKLMNSTILPNGKVVVTGGSSVWNELVDVNKIAETWDPTTGNWTLGAEAASPRLYHSTAVLLPDGTVLSAGGGAPAPPGAGTFYGQNAQIYYPPYLFTATGTRAVRPVISAAPQWLDLGKTFTVQTTGTGGVSRVTLVKTGSATHGWNFDQRFMDLTFTRTAGTGGDTLAVNSPARPGEAPPGYYMLFVFDNAGVPSESRIVRIGVAGPVNTAVAPVITGPGNLSGTVGATVSRQLVATDPNGDRLTYTAASLPPGLSINSSTGLISGTLATAGDYNVVVSVSDGTNSHSASFVWSVTPVTALTLTLTPTPGASLVNSGAVFNAQATGTNVQYSWNFGDGSADTAWSSSGYADYRYTTPGIYTVTLKVRDDSGAVITRSFLQTAYLGHGNRRPAVSSSLIVETPHYGRERIWSVNPDNDSITGFDAATRNKIGEVAVGRGPRSVAVTAIGDTEWLWVTNKDDATISIVDPATMSVSRTIALPRGSQPYGVAVSPWRKDAYVVLSGTGQLLRFNTDTYTQTGALAIGPNARHVSVSGDGAKVFVSRFITPPLPGEGTASVSTPATVGGEVVQIDVTAFTVTRTIVLAHSDKPDAENQGSGIPNYLGAVAVSIDGTQAYVPSKQDNIKRGTLRNGAALNFQNTVRAISSRIVLSGANAGTEDLARRIDHDNAAVASAALFDNRGVFLFVALETSREVAVLDAFSGAQIMRFDVGRAPQALALSEDGYTLYVSNFMDRTVTGHDLKPLLVQGLASVPTVGTMNSVATERLSAQVLKGKQFFYDARDTRLARDRYMSCATCHRDGQHDGRVWDFTHNGEGLRNTTSLQGRAGAQGRLHWSANFDEVQDFEAQIRALAGGTGLMTDAQFNTGTRAQPLGDRKTGVSADLDSLAAYVSSLTSFVPSPLRTAAGALTAEAAAGRTVFGTKCSSCHSGVDFTNSATGALPNIGTINAASGQRLGQPLTGIDVPTLRDVWATAPYLHNGSATTVQAAIQAHSGLTLSATDLANVVAFTQQIGSDEAAAPPDTSTNTPPTVSLTAPAAAQTVNVGAVLNLAATAADANGSVTKVEFLDNGVVIGTATSAPYALSWTASTAGTHSLSARATDNGGASTTSAPVVVTVQPTANTPPTVALTAPASAQTVNVGAVLTLAATASDANGSVTRVEFLDNGVVIGTVTAAPYAMNWTASTAGTHSLSARATDNGGASSTSGAVAVTVQPAANTPPTVALTAPASAQTVNVGTVLGLAATASDANGSVTRVEFLDNGVVIGTATAAPYAMNWTASTAGTHSLSARATDNDGASATSAPVVVTVPQVTANQPPTVAMTSPANGAIVGNGARVTLSANASDSDGSINRVEFYAGTSKLYTATAAPYAFGGSTTAAGRYVLTAKAYDNLGAVTTSTAISAVVAAAGTAPLPANTTACAAEGGSCTVPAGAIATVYYGADAYWFARTGQTGTVSCNAATFGDPLPTLAKSCSMLITTPASTGSSYNGPLPASAQFCAYETTGFNTCTLPARGAVTVYYGAGGKYKVKQTMSGTFACSNTTFGGDPYPSVNKSCWYSQEALPLASAVPNGMRGQYFNGVDLAGPALLTRYELPFFDWASASPGPGVPADLFSARWTGVLTAPTTGTYRLAAVLDDGGRVWVNGVQVVNFWNVQAVSTQYSSAVTLQAGATVSLRVEFQEFYGGAHVQLYWLPPGALAWSRLPASALRAD